MKPAGESHAAADKQRRDEAIDLLRAGGVAAVIAVGAARTSARSAGPEAVLEDRWAMLDQYCVGCHNDAELTGEFSFSG